MGTDIPLWIGGLQKWITGVTKHTTCGDVIRAVLASNDEKHPKSRPRNCRNYTVYERWHKMERPLDAKAKLLKVWNSWGREQCNVKFLLKKTSYHSQSTPKDVKAHRRKQKEGKNLKCRSTKTWHPRKLRSESEDDHLGNDNEFPATTKQLKNLILSQDEALASQLKKLQEKDEEIEYFENQIHMQRMNQIGVNYVQDTYLADSSEGESWSGSSNITPPNIEQLPSCDILDSCIELYEKVLQICNKVQEEEHHIKDLTSKLKQSISFNEKDSSAAKKDSIQVESDDPELDYAGPERLEEMLKRTRGDIERLLRISETQQQTIRQNEQTLHDCTKIIEDKHCYLQHLKSDLDRLDQDNTKLQEEFAAIQTIPIERFSTCDLIENGDNNSDTGLSSLHSSSDDGGVNVLDTLV